MALLSGCEDDASIASHNISKAADNFEINRRVVFYNGITDQYMLTIEGYCSIDADGLDNQLEVTCKVGDGEFKKHFLGLSDNVTYIAEQLDSAAVSDQSYRLVFKPQSLRPDIDFRGDVDELISPTRPDQPQIP